MAYFVDMRESIRFKWVQLEGSALFSAQKGAIYAVLAHFLTSDEPAIVSMPTGSGKTELMIALAYLLEARRVLVVTPSQVLREQAAARFSELDVFRRLGLIGAEAPSPEVHVQRSICASDDDWRALREADVVVATPKVISPGESRVAPPPEPGLFDLVMFDEAHHTPAPTWRALMSTFAEARKVLLTATPFRRDRRRLPGRLAFHYPIGRALDDGIYRAVEFSPGEYRVDVDETDQGLAELAAELFGREQGRGTSPRILVRVDRVTRADRLVEHYRTAGVRTEAVHYDRTSGQNASTISRLREGDLDAVVSVGMLGEGLDVPELKIAVLHAPPQSLPFTIQLLGRVSRNLSEHEGPAHLIAVPDTVRGEVRALYREDQDWERMIPTLMEAAIEGEYRVGQGPLGQGAGTLAVPAEATKPFFSIRLYSRGDWKEFDLDYDVGDRFEYSGMPRAVTGIHLLPAAAENAVVVVTEAEESPSWGRATGLLDVRFDLHVLYGPGHSPLVAVATTRDEICGPLIERIAPGLELLDPARLPGALRAADSYVTVGLANATGLTGAHPAYRMHIGDGAGSSIRRTDGRVFGAGHAVGRVDDRKVRGVAVKSRKAWEMRRDHLEPFLEWCNSIFASIEEPLGALPGLGFLATPGLVRELAEEPIAVILPDELTWQPMALRAEVEGETVPGDVWPFMEVIGLQANVLELELHWHEEEEPIKLSYGVGRTPLWEVEGSAVQVLLGQGPNLDYQGSLQRFFTHNPPSMVMPSGGIITGDVQWQLQHEVDYVPEGVLREKSWNGCDITKEAQAAEGDQVNVQEATLRHLEAEIPEDAIVIVDDAAYEIADYIVVEPTRKVVRFVHCKWSTKEEPGCRLDDMKDLLNQACRSHVWARAPQLFQRLVRQVDKRANTEILRGSYASLEAFAEAYRRNEWDYEVVAVQPGLLIEQVHGSEGVRMRPSIASAYEWLQSADARLVIWGS